MLPFHKRTRRTDEVELSADEFELVELDPIPKRPTFPSPPEVSAVRAEDAKSSMFPLPEVPAAREFRPLIGYPPSDPPLPSRPPPERSTTSSIPVSIPTRNTVFAPARRFPGPAALWGIGAGALATIGGFLLSLLAQGNESDFVSSAASLVDPSHGVGEVSKFRAVRPVESHAVLLGLASPAGSTTLAPSLAMPDLPNAAAVPLGEPLRNFVVPRASQVDLPLGAESPKASPQVPTAPPTTFEQPPRPVAVPPVVSARVEVAQHVRVASAPPLPVASTKPKVDSAAAARLADEQLKAALGGN